MTTNPTLSKRIIESLNARSESKQWGELIGNLLRRLELDATERRNAEADYEKLADDIASKLSIPRHDVEIFPQGSMRTQTTISQRYPIKFDLDVLVKLSGPKYTSPNPEVMFQAFGVRRRVPRAAQLHHHIEVELHRIPLADGRLRAHRPLREDFHVVPRDAQLCRDVIGELRVVSLGVTSLGRIEFQAAQQVADELFPLLGLAARV